MKPGPEMVEPDWCATVLLKVRAVSVERRIEPELVPVGRLRAPSVMLMRLALLNRRFELNVNWLVVSLWMTPALLTTGEPPPHSIASLRSSMMPEARLFKMALVRLNGLST